MTRTTRTTAPTSAHTPCDSTEQPFTAAGIVAGIHSKLTKELKEKISARVGVMVNSAAKRELALAQQTAENAHYDERKNKMLAGLDEALEAEGAVQAAKLEAWFAKSY